MSLSGFGREGLLKVPVQVSAVWAERLLRPCSLRKKDCPGIEGLVLPHP